MNLSNTHDAKRHTGDRSEKILSWGKLVSRIAKMTTAAIGVTLLSGCLMTSPYWGQSFSSLTDMVPLQAWATNKNYQVKFECATAYYADVFRFDGPVTWIEIDSVTPSQQSVKDSYGTKVYGAGIKKVLPRSCWRYDFGSWYSAVRVSQTTITGVKIFQNFNKTGIECLGKEIGKATSWFGWLNKGCVLTYSNSGNLVPFVIISVSS